MASQTHVCTQLPSSTLVQECFILEPANASWYPEVYGFRSMEYDAVLPQLPQWPSMLPGQPYVTNKPLPFQLTQPWEKVAHGPLPASGAFVSAKSAGQTIDEEKRRQIRQYFLEHPKCKQWEIGTHFGVERSTVSKILRETMRGRSSDRSPSTTKDAKKQQAPRTRGKRQRELSARTEDSKHGSIPIIAPSPTLAPQFRDAYDNSSDRSSLDRFAGPSDTTSSSEGTRVWAVSEPPVAPELTASPGQTVQPLLGITSKSSELTVQPPTSAKEALQALAVVHRFLINQNKGFLTHAESVFMGRVTEKVQASATG